MEVWWGAVPHIEGAEEGRRDLGRGDTGRGRRVTRDTGGSGVLLP